MNWAVAHIGSDRFDGLCTSFVRQAWLAAGVNLRAAAPGTYPSDAWPNIRGTRGQSRPPAPGALIFCVGTAAHPRTNSHVTIYIGGGRVVSTDDCGHALVHYENFGQHPREIGWWLPG